MNRLFRERALPGVAVDANNTPQEHDSVALRESRASWRLEHLINAKPRWSAWQQRVYGT